MFSQKSIITLFKKKANDNRNHRFGIKIWILNEKMGISGLKWVFYHSYQIPHFTSLFHKLYFYKISTILVFEAYKAINSDLHFKYIPLQRALHQLLTFFYYGHHT